jgi:hypothetical protein
MTVWNASHQMKMPLDSLTPFFSSTPFFVFYHTTSIMRFAIAATLLVDSVARVSSLEFHEKAALWLTNDKKDHERQHDLMSSNKVKNLKRNHPKSSQRVQSLLAKKFANDKDNMLKNANPPKVECDPHHHTEAHHPDEGILACGGMFQYCQESDESSLGGFCALSSDEDHSRALQTSSTGTALDAVNLVCNLDENSPNVECSVCTADEATYTGEFDCIYTSECLEVPGLCDDRTISFCGTDQLSGKVDGEDYYHRQSCFDMTEPTAFAYCDSLTIRGEDLTCEQSINGVTCNSCELAINPQTGEVCQYFDCTNTDFGIEGNDCRITFLEAIAVGYMYSMLPCPDGCSLCGEGQVMGTPANLFQTDAGETVSCLAFQSQAMVGNFSDTDYCTTLTDNVQGPCGCTGATNPAGARSFASSAGAAMIIGAYALAAAVVF